MQVQVRPVGMFYDGVLRIDDTQFLQVFAGDLYHGFVTGFFSRVETQGRVKTSLLFGRTEFTLCNKILGHQFIIVSSYILVIQQLRPRFLGNVATRVVKGMTGKYITHHVVVYIEGHELAASSFLTEGECWR